MTFKSSFVALAIGGALVGCGGDDDGGTDPGDGAVYATSTVVFSDDGQNTYVNLLTNVDAQTVAIGNGHEMPGWAGVWTAGGKLFVADGEAPTMTRYALGDNGALTADGAVSFLNYGASYADSAFISEDRAVLFAETGVSWDPSAMEVNGTFTLPTEPASPAAGLTYGGLRTGREFVARGNRAFIATNWANWDDYTVSEESLIVVLDTDTNTVVGSYSVPCPYIDVADLADDGTVYFSNWGYSVGQTLVYGKRQACVVRINPGQDAPDPTWSLKFADITNGREGAALRYLGNGKAVFSAYYDERITDLPSQTDLAELADKANWRLWTVDLATREASAIEGLDFNGGGYALQRVDGRAFLMMPSGDYASTTVYEVLANGTVEQRWTIDGWSTQLIKVRE